MRVEVHAIRWSQWKGVSIFYKKSRFEVDPNAGAPRGVNPIRLTLWCCKFEIGLGHEVSEILLGFIGLPHIIMSNIRFPL